MQSRIAFLYNIHISPYAFCADTSEPLRVRKLLLHRREIRKLIGKLIGHRYRIARRLGEGGTSVVYLATQERVGGKVAIKLLLESATEQQANRFTKRITRIDAVEPGRLTVTARADGYASAFQEIDVAPGEVVERLLPAARQRECGEGDEQRDHDEDLEQGQTTTSRRRARLWPFGRPPLAAPTRSWIKSWKSASCGY